MRQFNADSLQSKFASMPSKNFVLIFRVPTASPVEVDEIIEIEIDDSFHKVKIVEIVKNIQSFLKNNRLFTCLVSPVLD